MKQLDINKVIWEAPEHRSMKSLAKHFEMDVSTLKYHLGKQRKLQLVKRVIYWATDGKMYKAIRS